ncbi:MAG: PrgI family protein [Patescibacteria group bacterium]|nr:PrgI family protein [Patescibacteria group bacterium]
MPEKFIVPQFIDKEDQILGPITVRQFLIMLVAAFSIFIAYKLFQFAYFLVFTIFVAAFGGTFAFVKVNGQPFHVFFVNVLQTVTRPALRVWDKRHTEAELRAFMKTEVSAPVKVTPHKEKPESSRLRDLSLVVNTGGVYKPEDDQ